MELCRLCRTETPQESSKNIIFDHNDDLQVIDIILRLTGLKILENDPFPKIICGNCYEKLISFNDFRLTVLRVDTVFHQEFQQKIDHIKIEDDEFPIKTEHIIKNDPDCSTEPTPVEPDSEIETNEDTTDTAQYRCDLCGKIFARRKLLNIHIRSHRGEKPIQCNICNKPFAEQSHLKMHMKVHNGEQPYQCSLCDERFVQKQLLYNHLTTVHTDEKVYKCSFCDKTYAGKQYLNRHLQTHNKELKCKICAKTFALPSNLMAHLKVHNGEKPFVCDICHKGFSQKINLKMHSKVHNGVNRSLGQFVV